MEAEQIISLFDSIWFQNQIFQRKPKQSILETEPQVIPKTDFSKLSSNHVRSRSDEFSSISTYSEPISPHSVLFSPRLQTISSGKESKIETEFETAGATKQRRRKTERGSTKSLSDLEFEELKGFMDLGFVFSEDDVTSSLVEIIPGLQLLGKKKTDTGSDIDIDTDIEREGVKSDENVVQRPYLSEAWKELEEKKKINPLINWKIKGLESEKDVKQSLKWWAHSVATAIR